MCGLTVQLGRVLDFADDKRQGEPEMLHAPDPEAPYLRPIIGGRGQLGHVARGRTS
ncbi:hypothetical protein [Amycolatopsis sp. EV170708-02-1]|uniref:hypothetical protein n=1 Tax=Amycolatopsis sp. EV170708-02-1 TaxID=2919322 RepID=UPI001F0C8F70|nr:hypothetical protein [Amycolatopsis sp. EV170708-02-1]UMP06095.1 hypothetical protein MJQ72_15320 [Amycolatopsis sp. EV170708-02-1]